MTGVVLLHLFTSLSCQVSNNSCSNLNLSIADSFDIKVADSLYDPFFGYGGAKTNYKENTLILLSENDEFIWEYDFSNGETVRCVRSKVISGKPHIFSVSALGQGTYLVCYNPIISNGLHDKFIGIVSDSGIYFPIYNFKGSGIATSNTIDSLDWRSSTFPNPFGMTPVLYSDSSILLPCFHNFIPGTKSYASNNKGDFVRLYPSNYDKPAMILKPKFQDIVQGDKLFGKNHAWQYGWFEDQKIIWSYGISNDISIYHIDSDSLVLIKRANPLIEEISSIDTLVDPMRDANQVRFLDLIHNPFNKEIYRVVQRPSSAGFTIILMDEKFNEIGKCDMPSYIRSPFFASKRGLTGYSKRSEYLDKTYRFVEFKFHSLNSSESYKY